MSHPAAPCHLDRTTATAVTEARTPTAVQRHVMDLLDIDPGHHPLVRLSIAEWARVNRVVAALERVYGGAGCICTAQLMGWAPGQACPVHPPDPWASTR